MTARGGKARRFVASFFRHEQWNIGIAPVPIQAFLQPETVPAISWLPPPSREEFRADPFGFQADDSLHIFYELFDYSTHQGRLHHLEVKNGNIVPGDTRFIDTDVHASYPHIFRYKDDLYCVPETKEAREVVLYRAAGPMNQWQRLRVLVSGDACTDPTIFEYQGRWYLMCGGPGLDHDHDLYIWHADTPLSDWRPHKKNPVKAGDRRSRPGGTVFEHDGGVFRPAQDGTSTYGGGLVIYKILRLSPEEFEEEPVAILGPDRHGPYPAGIHTLSAAGDVTLVDGKRHVFSFGEFRRRLGSVTSKLLSIRQKKPA